MHTPAVQDLKRARCAGDVLADVELDPADNDLRILPEEAELTGRLSRQDRPRGAAPPMPRPGPLCDPAAVEAALRAARIEVGLGAVVELGPFDGEGGPSGAAPAAFYNVVGRLADQIDGWLAAGDIVYLHSDPPLPTSSRSSGFDLGGSWLALACALAYQVRYHDRQLGNAVAVRGLLGPVPAGKSLSRVVALL